MPPKLIGSFVVTIQNKLRKNMIPILQSPLLCRFHLKFDADEGPEEGFYISQLSRNRVAAVIDCLNYLRYIKQGLVKSHVNDVYWEIMHLRSKMTLARFGYMAD